MEYEKSALLNIIGDTPENRLIDFFMEGIGIGYTITDLSEGCDISRPTVYKIIPELLEEGVIKIQRKIGRIILYELNKENKKVKALMRLESILLEESFDNVEEKEVLSNKSSHLKPSSH